MCNLAFVHNLDNQDVRQFFILKLCQKRLRTTALGTIGAKKIHGLLTTFVPFLPILNLGRAQLL
jgi:hypothetical protein